MNLPEKRLCYRSRLDPKRIVKMDVVDVNKLTTRDVVMAVRVRGGRVRALTRTVFFRRHAYMHLNRRTGDVFYYRPDVEEFPLGEADEETKVHVGIQGGFE